MSLEERSSNTVQVNELPVKPPTEVEAKDDSTEVSKLSHYTSTPATPEVSGNEQVLLRKLEEMEKKQKQDQRSMKAMQKDMAKQQAILAIQPSLNAAAVVVEVGKKKKGSANGNKKNATTNKSTTVDDKQKVRGKLFFHILFRDH